MRVLLARVSRAYGTNPLHLLVLLACFALAGYVVTRLVDEPLFLRILIWFAGAVIAHDLVLFPLYAVADRSLRAGLRALLPHPRTASVPSPLNYLRVPMLGSGLLFLIFFPGILRQGRQTYQNATGQDQEPYLGRWLLLVAAMFAISAVSYALRLRQTRAGTRRRPRTGTRRP